MSQKSGDGFEAEGALSALPAEDEGRTRHNEQASTDEMDRCRELEEIEHERHMLVQDGCFGPAHEENAAQIEPGNDPPSLEPERAKRFQAAKDFGTDLKAIRERATASAKESAETAEKLRTHGVIHYPTNKGR